MTAVHLAELVQRTRAELPPGAACTAASVARWILQQQLHRAELRGVLCVAQHLPAEQPHLLALLAERDPRRRQLLLQRVITDGEWERQIRALCRRWRSDGVDPAELYQAGVEGLLIAAERWRPGQGWRTYAYSWIEYRISECIRLCDAGPVAESQREIRQRRRSGGEARTRSWAPLHEGLAAEGDDAQELDRSALVHLAELSEARQTAVRAWAEGRPHDQAEADLGLRELRRLVQ